MLIQSEVVPALPRNTCLFQIWLKLSGCFRLRLKISGMSLLSRAETTNPRARARGELAISRLGAFAKALIPSPVLPCLLANCDLDIRLRLLALPGAQA